MAGIDDLRTCSVISRIHHRRNIIVAVSLGAAMFVSVRSHADEPSTENRALAEILFREAKALSDKQQFDQACPKFSESHRLDPKPGTILNLAVCHEKQGKVASAWLDYIEAATFAARAGQKDREQFARDQAAKLEKLLPHVIVKIPKSTPGLIIKLDAAVLDEAAWGKPMPVNPGAHLLEARAAGYKPWSTTVAIEKMPGDVETIIPELEKDATSSPETKPVDPPTDKPVDKPADKPADKPVDGPSTGGKSTAGPEKPKPPPPPPPPPPAFNKPLWIGVGVAGIGAAGLIVGSIFGGRTYDFRDAGDAECRVFSGASYCTKKGLDLHAQAQTSASISTASFVVGGVGLAAGAALVLVGLRNKTPRASHAWVLPQVERTRAGISAGLSF